MTTPEGVRRAATFLLALDAESASKILRHLPDPEVTLLTEEMARMNDLSDIQVDEALRSYHDADEVVRVEPQLRKILDKALGHDKAKELLERIKQRRRHEPFQLLRRLDARSLQVVMSGEHPQVHALVIAHLDAALATDLLRGMDEELRYEVVRRMATIGEMPVDMIRQVDEVLSERALEVSASGETGGEGNRYKSIAEVLNQSEPGVTKAIIDRLGQDEPEAAAEIQALMFVFEDLSKIPDKEMQKILSSIDKDLLPLALKTASPELSDKLLGNMSKRARETMLEEMEILGPKPLAEVEEAQKAIVEVVRRMIDDGEVTIDRGAQEMV
ncbi:MAG: flagellar motor switch protein FliG [Planctomycetota bacterium]|jgi:flagellar motor switch protein FliG